MQTAASAEFLDSLLEKVRGLDPLSLDPVEVRRISREARRAGRAADLRVAFAGNVVFDPLPEFLEAQLLCRGMKAVSYTAPFGQPLQSLLDPRSALRQFDPDFLLLHFELEALLPGIVDRRAADADCWKAGVSEVLEAIQPTVRAALDHTRAVVLLTNFAGPDCYELGIADSRAEFGEQEFFAQLNLELARLWQETRKTVLFITHSIAEAVFLSDRIAVMSRNPGRIVEIIDVDLPRPRSLALRETTAFTAYTKRIRSIFTQLGVLKEG